MITRTLAELAALCSADLEGNGARVVEGPATLRDATQREISFFANPKYGHQLESTRAGAVIVARDTRVTRSDLDLLRCADPSKAFTAVIQAFVEAEPAPRAGVHPRAVVDPTAEIAASASVGPLCVVEAGAVVAEHAVLHASVFVGAGARIGAHTSLKPGVVVYPRVEVGQRCLVHSGTVLGADGYGFEPTDKGWMKIPQCGTVVVEDDVEIGANVTIDRGRFGATRIGRGAKLDNLVHVAHNVDVGPGALLVAQVGIAGSSRIGPRAILGGQVGVAGHSEIGAGARVAAQSGTFGDVPAGADYLGYPARPRGDALRALALSHRMPQLLERLRELERRLARIEGKQA